MNPDLTKICDELEALEAISSSGPWLASSRRLSSETDMDFYIADGGGHSCNDAALIAAARNHLKALIQAARDSVRLAERVKELEGIIEDYKQSAMERDDPQPTN